MKDIHANCSTNAVWASVAASEKWNSLISRHWFTNFCQQISRSHRRVNRDADIKSNYLYISELLYSNFDEHHLLSQKQDFPGFSFSKFPDTYEIPWYSQISRTCGNPSYIMRTFLTQANMYLRSGTTIIPQI